MQTRGRLDQVELTLLEEVWKALVKGFGVTITPHIRQECDNSDGRGEVVAMLGMTLTMKINTDIKAIIP